VRIRAVAEPDKATVNEDTFPPQSTSLASLKISGGRNVWRDASESAVGRVGKGGEEERSVESIGRRRDAKTGTGRGDGRRLLLLLLSSAIPVAPLRLLELSPPSSS